MLTQIFCIRTRTKRSKFSSPSIYKLYFAERSRSADCEPNSVFRQNNLFCRCNKHGFWLSEKCKETFSYFYPRTNVPDKALKTNLECTANNYYLIDCNICRCSDNNVFDVTLCTSRRCGHGHKAESCINGDILRLENELCVCSDINYYIDRLCINILNEVVQPLETKDVMKLEDIGKTWRLMSELSTELCDSDLKYTVDCRDCACKGGHLVCTTNDCKETKELKKLRQERVIEISHLPELESNVGASCKPGKMYRYKCNVCTCTKHGTPSCTKMVCVQNFDLDLSALRGVLSSG